MTDASGCSITGRDPSTECSERVFCGINRDGQELLLGIKRSKIHVKFLCELCVSSIVVLKYYLSHRATEEAQRATEVYTVITSFSFKAITLSIFVLYS